jgi:NAD(P)-dependent dehydrogenase (short-subunit alcohol dehydrogenase family)
MEIAGKVAVVSGGASGIGRASVLALAERGASVVIADLDEERGRQTVEMATARGGIAHFCRCDVTQSGDIEAVFETALERYGRFDIAFNNAGISGEDLFADDPGDWKRLIAIDLTAVIDATRFAVRALRRTGAGGVIINTASLIGLWPMPSAPIYAAAKAGVVNFSRSLAHLAEESRIRVNTICPELVDTPMARALGEERLVELRRVGGILRPEAIAAGVLELIEDGSRFGAMLQITSGGGREYVTP